MLNFLCYFVLFIAVKIELKLTLYHMGNFLLFILPGQNLKSGGFPFFKVFCHKEIMAWTSGFPEITGTSSAH